MTHKILSIIPDFFYRIAGTRETFKSHGCLRENGYGIVQIRIIVELAK